MTDKEFVLTTMREYGMRRAQDLQETSEGLMGTELAEKEDYIPDFSAAVAITVAGGWSEVRFTYTVLDESGQNLFTVVLCNAVNLLKAWKSLLLCFVTQSFKLWIDVKKTHGSIISL